MDDRNTLDRIARAIEMSSREIARSREIFRKINELHRLKNEPTEHDVRATHTSSALNDDRPSNIESSSHRD
jgi:hypothetical protein